jgi:NAD(P)H-dependent flavin oxidoreductase YrpB (nitropropane dioxygenase family)
MEKYKLVEINSVSINKTKTDVFDLTVDKNHSYVANKIHVHNCLTTKQTSVGYPLGSLIKECYEIKKEMINEYSHNYFHSTDKDLLNQKIDSLPKIVADGGMKDYSDIIKSLALGADLIMVGSIFNKALESSGQNYLHKWKINRKLAKFLYHRGFTIRKQFYGMSTKIAQKKMGKTNLKTSEGVVRYRNVEYTLHGWVDNFKSYLASAMSYSGAKSLNEFIGKTKIIFITRNAFNRFNK